MPADNLKVIFARTSDVNNYLFRQAVQWSEESPNDFVNWYRREKLVRFPNVDVEWTETQIETLFKIIFYYTEKTSVGGSLYTDMSSERTSDVAAIIVSFDSDVRSSLFETLISSLATLCTQSLAKAVICVEIYDDEVVPNVVEEPSPVPEDPRRDVSEEVERLNINQGDEEEEEEKEEEVDLLENSVERNSEENSELENYVEHNQEEAGDDYVYVEREPGNEELAEEVELNLEEYLKTLDFIARRYCTDVSYFDDTEGVLRELTPEDFS